MGERVGDWQFLLVQTRGWRACRRDSSHFRSPNRCQYLSATFDVRNARNKGETRKMHVSPHAARPSPKWSVRRETRIAIDWRLHGHGSELVEARGKQQTSSAARAKLSMTFGFVSANDYTIGNVIIVCSLCECMHTGRVTNHNYSEANMLIVFDSNNGFRMRSIVGGKISSINYKKYFIIRVITNNFIKNNN